MKAAKDYINSCLARRAGVKRKEWNRGNTPSYCYCFTGVKWQHENSGEMMEEYYKYTLKKV